jgi:hypothetical protein
MAVATSGRSFASLYHCDYKSVVTNTIVSGRSSGLKFVSDAFNDDQSAESGQILLEEGDASEAQRLACHRRGAPARASTLTLFGTLRRHQPPIGAIRWHRYQLATRSPPDTGDPR